MKNLKYRRKNKEGKLIYQKIVSKETIEAWTGIKDFNGLDLYVGDVVKIFPHSEALWEVVWHYDSNGYRCKDMSTTELIFIPLLPDSYYLVGNIHEMLPVELVENSTEEV